MANKSEVAGATDRISVVMCTYNGEAYLVEQLQTITEQSRLPDELVVADDGSTDATLFLLCEFVMTAPFPVRLLGGEAQPLGVTRNFERAMRASSGSIIVLSDQDDLWHVDRLLRTEEAFAEEPGAGYLFSDAEIMDHRGVTQAETLWRRVGLSAERLAQFQGCEQVTALLNGGNFTYGMSMALRRTVLDFILPIESTSPSFTHDAWSALILSALGQRGIAVNERLVRYRQHSRQVVGSGGVRLRYWTAVLRSLSSPRIYDSQLPNALRAASRRVTSCEPASAEAVKAAALIEGKALHLHSREKAYRGGLLSRVRIVAQEFVSGRYGQFSASWRTALRDLLA